MKTIPEARDTTTPTRLADLLKPIHPPLVQLNQKERLALQRAADILEQIADRCEKVSGEESENRLDAALAGGYIEELLERHRRWMVPGIDAGVQR